LAWFARRTLLLVKRKKPVPTEKIAANRIVAARTPEMPLCDLTSLSKLMSFISTTP